MASLVSFYVDEPLTVPDGGRRVRVEQRPIRQARNFDLGHPEPDIAYVRHPRNPLRLIPLADYHGYILVEKTNEAITMLTRLGASRIRLSHSSHIADQAKADIEVMLGVVRIHGQKSASQDVTIIYESQGAGADPRPLPPMLWLDEPGWRGIAEGRVYGGLRHFTMSYTFDQHSGVDAELAARVGRMGLNVGVEYRKAHRVSFNLEGDFPRIALPPKASANALRSRGRRATSHSSITDHKTRTSKSG